MIDRMAFFLVNRDMANSSKMPSESKSTLCERMEVTLMLFVFHNTR